MPIGIQTRAQDAVTATVLRNGLLVTTALAPIMLGGLLSLAPDPAFAACTVAGTGVIGALNSGDVATCTGPGNTNHINATGGSNVTVNIGDGTLTSLLPGAGIPAIVYDSTSNSNVTINNQATVSTYSGAVLLSNGSNNNNVTIAAGAIAEGTGNAEAAVVIDNSNGNLVNIRGTAVGTGANTTGLRIGGNANVVTVYQGGSIGGGHTGVQFITGGNTLINAGTISGGFFIAIQGSSGTDTILNSGTISGGGSGAIDLFGGDDVLTLAPGSTITGFVFGGTGTDTLRFGGNGSATFDLGTLGGGVQYLEFEQLAKVGSSVWTLTGTTAFNGAMTVDAGGLIVNGTLPSVVTVNGGYLGGTGTVGGIVVNNGGMVATGNSIGTLNVSGNVTFNAGSTFQVEINAGGQSDKIAATGTATLNGGTVQIVPLGAGFLANTQYTILTATGGVTGTFATLTTSGSPLVSGQLSYDANNVYFLLQQIGGFGTLSGLTPNQAAVAGALDQAQSGGASGPLGTAINTLAVLNASGIKAGLDDLAGQIHADGRRFTTDQADAFQGFMWNAGTQSRGETLRMSVSSYAAEPADPIGKAPGARRARAERMVWRLRQLGQGGSDRHRLRNKCKRRRSRARRRSVAHDGPHRRSRGRRLDRKAADGGPRRQHRGQCRPWRLLRAWRERRIQSRIRDQLFLRGARILAHDLVPGRNRDRLLAYPHLCRIARHRAAVRRRTGCDSRAVRQGRLVCDAPERLFRDRRTRRESGGASRRLRHRLWHGRSTGALRHHDAERSRGGVRRDTCHTPRVFRQCAIHDRGLRRRAGHSDRDHGRRTGPHGGTHRCRDPVGSHCRDVVQGLL
nr:autotransporter outer membrane beta-barrel domain-containing protein [Bradyrhizobium sp. WSM2254]